MVSRTSCRVIIYIALCFEERALLFFFLLSLLQFDFGQCRAVMGLPQRHKNDQR